MDKRTAYGMMALPLLFVSLLMFLLVGPTRASAGWPFEGGTYGLLFGRTYADAAGKQFTHSGLDIAASAASLVLAPLSGQVSFIGRVPAGEGETQLAVSLTLEDGRIVSLMPFEEVSVARAQQVVEGSVLGVLSDQGDRSSIEPHLHVGLRAGSLYLDPATLLMPPAAQKPGVGVEAPVLVISPAAEPAAASAPLGQEVSLPTIVQARSEAMAPSGEGATTNVRCIPEIELLAPVSVGNSLRAAVYGGDTRLLRGIQELLGRRVSARTAALTVFSALMGSVVCFGALRGRAARRTVPDESSDETPARDKVAAAAGRW